MIEIDIPTGFVVDKQVLRDFERDGEVFDIWKRSRFKRQKVYMHIDYVSTAGYSQFVIAQLVSWSTERSS